MQPQQASPIREFGDFELDTLKRVLVSRATGQTVDITGRVVDALVYLVEHAGQLVEKKALIDALWPHVVVEEGSLTQTIHVLRRALGEQAGEHRYIATVPGRGYRFVAEVKLRGPGIITSMEAPRRPTRILAWSAIAIAVVVIGLLAGTLFLGRDRTPTAASPALADEPPSIAVLPFVDMSESQDQEHFAEGLSEEILNLLARADALRVIARTSSFSFKDENADIGTIAKRLSVTHVLEGSVRKSGERVRITAQLIDGATSAHVWSDTFDRDIDDIFGVQREIATAVADALHVTLRSPMPTRAETRSTQAYEHYLQGRHLFNRRSGSDILQAKARFENAVQIDPDYGRAWSALAGVYLVARYEGFDLPDAMRNWGVAVERATTLSPDLAEAHVRAAQYYWHEGDAKKARAHLDRATMLDPLEPLLVSMAMSQEIAEGRLDEVIEKQKKLVAADPLSAINRGNLGGYLMLAGRLEEAQREFERSLELSPTMIKTMASIADVLMLQGRHDEALNVASRMPAGYLRDQSVAMAQFARGNAAESEILLARLQDRAARPDFDFDIALAIAETYAARNDRDNAFTWLETARRRAQSQHGATGPWVLYDRLLISANLKPLRADPRWEEFRPREK